MGMGTIGGTGILPVSLNDRQDDCPSDLGPNVGTDQDFRRML